MSKHFKTLLSVGIAALGALALSACSPSNVTLDDKDVKNISVQATGSASVVPDVVRVVLQVSDLKDSTEEAVSSVSSALAKVRETLKSAEIDDADVKTETLSISPEYTYSQDNGQTLVGYRAFQVVSVIIRDADSAGSVIDDVVSSGGNLVSVFSATPVVDDTTQAAKDARKDAIQKARAQAEQYAELLGFELGGVIHVSEVSAPSYVYGAPRMEADKAQDASVVDLGTEKVSITVEVRWEIR